MKLEFVFIRHGESTGNVIHQTHNKDIDFLLELTKQGEEQANATKDIVQKELFDNIFCSDLIRTKQTAEIIFGHIYDIVFDERLRESYLSTDKDFVVHSNEIPRSERIQMRIKGFETGEKFEVQVERIRNFIDMLVTGEYGNKIAIVTHSGCLRALECICNNMSLEDALYFKRTDNGGIKRLFINKDENEIQYTLVS